MTIAPAERELKRIYETDSATVADARIQLELKYAAILQPTQAFNRRLVSFQANKRLKMHRWFKYKEAFSAYVLDQRKGNSCQQLGKYGREALRKSILIWQKPE